MRTSPVGSFCLFWRQRMQVDRTRRLLRREWEISWSHSLLGAHPPVGLQQVHPHARLLMADWQRVQLSSWLGSRGQGFNGGKLSWNNILNLGGRRDKLGFQPVLKSWQCQWGWGAFHGGYYLEQVGQAAEPPPFSLLVAPPPPPPSYSPSSPPPPHPPSSSPPTPSTPPCPPSLVLVGHTVR